jgi:hypothetical protein
MHILQNYDKLARQKLLLAKNIGPTLRKWWDCQVYQDRTGKPVWKKSNYGKHRSSLKILVETLSAWIMSMGDVTKIWKDMYTITGAVSAGETYGQVILQCQREIWNVFMWSSHQNTVARVRRRMLTRVQQEQWLTIHTTACPTRWQHDMAARCCLCQTVLTTESGSGKLWGSHALTVKVLLECDAV